MGKSPVAREYLRVSADSSGRQRSPEEQTAENAVHADEQGWTLGKAYREDTAVSASKYGRKVRTAFAQLMADLESGRFRAKVLILWEVSRLSRQMDEWVPLVKACAKAGVDIYVTSDERLYRITNDEDRLDLLQAGLNAEREAAKTSKRTRRAQKSNAANGKPHGAIPYGYMRTYGVNAKGRRVVLAQLENPEEAPNVRRMFELLHKGTSLVQTEKTLAAEGVRRRSGKPFSRQHIRALVLNPAYAGQRVHHGALTAGTWEPLVDLRIYHDVTRRLRSNKRTSMRPGRAHHLLTGIARCDACGTGLRGQAERYLCPANHVQVHKGDLDAIAEQAILGYLSREDVFVELNRDDEAADAVRAELSRVRGELQEAEDAEPQTPGEAKMMGKLIDKLTAAVVALEERERELAAPPELLNLVTPGATIGKQWAGLSLAQRKRVAALVFVPRLLGELRVIRSYRKGFGVRQPVSERVVFAREE